MGKRFWLLWLGWTLLWAAPLSARSRSGQNLDALADEFYWALQSRELRPNVSERGNAAWADKLARFSRRLDRIKTSNLNTQQRITHQMLASAIGQQRHHVTDGWIQEDLNAVESPLTAVYSSVEGVDKRTVNDWRWIIKTLRSSEKLARDYVTQLERGLDAKRARSADVVRSCIESLSPLTSRQVGRNPFLGLERTLEQNLAGHRLLKRLKRELRHAVHQVAIPAHLQLRRYLQQRYLPRAPESPTLSRERYLHYMARYLGPGYDPDKLAAYGRREVARLHREMGKTARQINPRMRSLSAFMRGLGLRKDRSYSSGKQLLAAAKQEVSTAKMMARKMAPIPESTVKVEPVPATEAAVIDAQYYAAGPTSGVLQLNTGPLMSAISRYELPNYITHEVYGGHHLQAMYALKQQGLPEFRRDASLKVSDEGWAVYAEHWRNARGGYTPEQRIGHLVNQAWAAANLVVDVGLHTGAMTRRQAESYLAKAMFTGREAVSAEVDRILNFPGHGLAYYVGKRELLATKKQVRRILGRRFDERRFHAKLLSLGSVPPRAAREVMVSWARRRNAQLDRGLRPSAGRN